MQGNAKAMQYNTLQYATIRYNTLHYTPLQGRGGGEGAR